MKIISWNINGIRACYKKGLDNFLSDQMADIFCLQEIKAFKEQFPSELLTQYPYHYIYSAKKAGYSGVSIISKKKPLKITYGIGIKEFDDEGRVLIAEYNDFVLLNCYFPNGQRDHARVAFKLKFSDKVLLKCKKIMSQTKKPVIVCGDFNTAHSAIDLANPKTNTKTTGFLPHERAWIDKFIASGFTDTFRTLHPSLLHQYTWWTYRGDCRERNIGWRIDYFFVSQKLVSKIKESYHLPSIVGSDHCPVVLNLNLS